MVDNFPLSLLIFEVNFTLLTDDNYCHNTATN